MATLDEVFKCANLGASKCGGKDEALQDFERHMKDLEKNVSPSLDAVSKIIRESARALGSCFCVSDEEAVVFVKAIRESVQFYANKMLMPLQEE